MSDNEKLEQRKLLWTTFENINKWFNQLKIFFVEKGFARLATKDDDVEGELFFFPDQLHRILNIDESEVSTDGTTKELGGRPTTKPMSTSSTLPKGATSTNKSSYTAAFIGGSTTAGWPIPPHFQLISDAKDENKKVEYVFFEMVKSIRGMFGFDHLHTCGITVNSNEKGGMNEEQFEKYMYTSIVPLYENARDEAGYPVAVMVDSGPGRMNVVMLANLRARGFYLLPGPPNTTAVTQATDQNYGEFKRVYRTNLKQLTKYKFK